MIKVWVSSILCVILESTLDVSSYFMAVLQAMLNVFTKFQSDLSRSGASNSAEVTSMSLFTSWITVPNKSMKMWWCGIQWFRNSSMRANPIRLPQSMVLNFPLGPSWWLCKLLLDPHSYVRSIEQARLIASVEGMELFSMSRPKASSHLILCSVNFWWKGMEVVF